MKKFFKSLEKKFREKSYPAENRGHTNEPVPDEVMGLKDKESAKDVAHFFESMGLPIPEGAEGGGCHNSSFHFTTDNGRIVLLSRFGCVIRITPWERRLKESHDRLLMPLFARRAGNYLIEITPGLQLLKRDKEVRGIRQSLDSENVFIDDGHLNNFGYIPGTKYAVILDLDNKHVSVSKAAANKLSKSVKKVKEVLAANNIVATASDDRESVQGRTYGELSRIICDAWPEDSKSPDPKGVRRFWETCLEMKNNGFLLSSWEEKQKPFPGVEETHFMKKFAYHYERQLEKAPSPLLPETEKIASTVDAASATWYRFSK